MKRFRKMVAGFGRGLHTPRLNPLHVGFVLGLYNLMLIDVFALTAFAAPSDSNTWEYIVYIAPFAFLVLWLWSSYAITRTYKRISFHDAVIIAKWSVWPFLALMILGASFFLLGTQDSALSAQWTTITYYIFLSAMSLIITGFAMTSFLLRHPFKK